MAKFKKQNKKKDIPLKKKQTIKKAAAPKKVKFAKGVFKSSFPKEKVDLN